MFVLIIHYFIIYGSQSAQLDQDEIPYVSIVASLTSFLRPRRLCNLPSNSTWDCQRRVCISEEPSGVCLDLRHLEGGTCVYTIGVVNTSCEGSLDAADTVGVLLIANRVGERNPWWASGTLCSLMDMGSGEGG